MPADQMPSFSSAFNSRFTFGKAANLTGQFGTGVLDSLIEGIDDFCAAAASERPSPPQARACDARRVHVARRP
jgi:hypothetical protein